MQINLCNFNSAWHQVPKPESRYCDKLHTLFIENKHTKVKLSLQGTMHDKNIIYFQPQINP